MRITSRQFATLSSLTALAALSFAAGLWIAFTADSQPVEKWEIDGVPIQAASATNNDSFAIATGPIDEDVEGFVTLDFMSGELQCAVINRFTGKFTALFKANVAADLGVAQNTKYLMTTGNLNIPGLFGSSVIYVLDTSSGNFAAYSIPWRKDLDSARRPQGGPLALIDVGKARNVPLRGQ